VITITVPAARVRPSVMNDYDPLIFVEHGSESPMSVLQKRWSSDADDRRRHRPVRLQPMGARRAPQRSGVQVLLRQLPGFDEVVSFGLATHSCAPVSRALRWLVWNASLDGMIDTTGRIRSGTSRRFRHGNHRLQSRNPNIVDWISCHTDIHLRRRE
jgi:hypothetical protein